MLDTAHSRARSDALPSAPPGQRLWREPPIALQILVLLFGGLVIAQVVTLMLTMVVPPVPPAQHDMRDLVAALRGGREAGSLARDVQAGPPDVSGAGWFSSRDSQSQLARLLDVPSDDVRLAFYAPLPFAGISVLPLHPPPPHRIGVGEGPLMPPPPIAEPIAWTVSPEPLRPRPVTPDLLIAAAYQPPGAPGGSIGGLPGGSFPGAGFPGQAFPGGGRTMPGQAGSRPGAIGRDLQQSAPPPSPGDLDAQPAAPSSHTAGPPVDPGPAAAEPGIADIRAATEIAPQPAAAAAGDGIAIRDDAQPKPHALPPRAQPSASAPAPAMPAEPVRRKAPAPTRPPATTARTASSGAVPVPIQPHAKALFGLAPAPFVEGDFVAAMRRSDGQWVVVQPVAEGFPNAWQRRVLLWFAVSFILVAPIGWLYARHIVKPLARFTSAAEQLGRDPSAALVALEGPAEIGRAAHAFNVMQSRLRSFVDERTAMVGAISHDLRTPLTRLQFRIEEVEDEAIRTGMNQEVAEMEAMITSVLTFIRDASTPNVRERLDLGLLVEDVAQDAMMIGGDIEVESLPPAPVEVDVLGMRRLLANLVENAVKYGDRARIRMRIEEDAAVAEIEDDGPGIPEEELERAFEPFYRASNAERSGKKGTGLGLAVCRSIARAHGGDVVLVRSSEGFAAQLRLPLVYDATRLAA